MLWTSALTLSTTLKWTNFTLFNNINPPLPYFFYWTYIAFNRNLTLREWPRSLINFFRIEDCWIISKRGYPIYLRSTIIGIQSALGVRAPDTIILFVIISLDGPYFSISFCQHLLITSVDGNYASCVLPQYIAINRDHQQNLELFDNDILIIETSTMKLSIL